MCAACLVGACVVFLVFAEPLWRRRVYTYDDLSQYHIPVRWFYARCLANGDAFDWCPDIWCGYYLHGDGQAGMYHPWHWFLYRLFPLDVAINLEMLASYPVLFVGMFLFLRRWQIPTEGAIFGSSVFTFSSVCMLRSMHLNAVAVTAHLPWLLLAIDVLARTDRPSRAALAQLAMVLLTASQLLLSHPNSVLISSLVESAYCIWLVARRPAIGTLRVHTTVRLVAVFGMAKVLAILLAGVQLLPTWDALASSWRQRLTRKELAEGSLHPANVVQLVAPYFFPGRVHGVPRFSWRTHEYGFYMGGAVPALLAWLLARRAAAWQAKELAVAVLIMGACALAVSFGGFLGPLFRLYVQIPVVNWFRIPSRYLVIAEFGMAIAAAVALTDLAQFSRRKQRLPLRQLWPLAAVVLVAAMPVAYRLVVPAQPVGRQTATFDSALLGFALVVCATALTVTASQGNSAALAGLILFAVADQGFYGLGFILKTPAVTIESLVSNHPHPPGPIGPHRVLEDIPNNVLMMRGVRLAAGYVGMTPTFQMTVRTSFARIVGVRWWGRGKKWRELPDPLPRARLVTRLERSHDLNRDIRYTDLETTALVATRATLSNEIARAGSAEIVTDRPGHITIDTDAPTRQLLVLSDRFHEGWVAQVDGRPTEVIRVYGDFLGCFVEQGVHTIEFRFQPASLARGKLLSVLGGVLTILFPATAFIRSLSTCTLDRR